MKYLLDTHIKTRQTASLFAADEPPVQTVQLAPSAAWLRAIGAASARVALGRTSHNPPVVGSSPTRPTTSDLRRNGYRRAVDRIVDRCR